MLLLLKNVIYIYIYIYIIVCLHLLTFSNVYVLFNILKDIKKK